MEAPLKRILGARIQAIVYAFMPWLYDQLMETQTIQALAAITDEGLFERIATAVLRLVPDYEGIAHTGINADGKTRKSPVDGLRFIGEGGSRLIIAHHTITASDGLERKWLLDPATARRRKDSKPPPPGDVVKSMEIVKAERAQAPQLAATLILATNQEPDEALIRKAVAAGRAIGMTVDVWSRSRIAAKLDDPPGQFIRRKLLGIEAELLSRPLLEDLSATSLATFDAADDPATRVPRALDASLVAVSRPLTFLASPSGSGKTVASHKALQAHRAAGGVALIVPHAAVKRAATLEQAVMAALHQLHPSLVPGQNVFALFSEEDPLLLLVEDVCRSSQPQRLIEQLAGWAPKAVSNANPPWKLLCPVWPHLLGGVRSQFQERITAMTFRPEPMSLSEATTLVTACARRAQVSIDEHRARQIAAALGSDPLLIALNRNWTAPRAEVVIERFVSDALVRCSSIDKFLAAELHAAMLTLGQAMLSRSAPAPAWSEVLGWGLASETIAAIKCVVSGGEILRIDGPALDTHLRFRHDRVRDWLLVTAAFDLEAKVALTDATLADPAFAEIVGALLVRAEASDALLQRVQAQTPLALFHALRVAPIGAPSTHLIAEAAMEWLCDPDHHGVATQTLRWQAMAAIEEVEGNYMPELIGLFRTDWPMGLVARLRNGDVQGGITLSRYDLSTVVDWTLHALAAAKKHLAKMVADMGTLLDGYDNFFLEYPSPLIKFAGVLGEPALAPALERRWERDESRADHLDVYLWAMARCATPETAARLLQPVCAAWGALPQECGDNALSSRRDALAALDVRFGFERAVPLGALDYFVERAQLPDLSWQIEYMLHGVDHPTAILLQVERGAERLRAGDDSYFICDQARTHWKRRIEGRGAPMSPTSRDALLGLWRDWNEDRHRRRSAFDLWAASRGADDLAILRDAADDPEFGEQILRQRLVRGDALAIPALVDKLDGEHGMRWWYYTRHVWSSALYNALDRALAREAAKALPDEDEQYEIGLTLTAPLMRLPPADAEPLLLRHWASFGETSHFVQAALHVGTQALLDKAAALISANPEPSKLFKYIIMHFGIRMKGEAGITREQQIHALAPYLSILSPEEVRVLAQVCNDKGWYGLRRELIDPLLCTEDLAQSETFRGLLDKTLESTHPAWIEHQIDFLRKADVSWAALAEILLSWLASQPTLNALEIAQQVILYAGVPSDVEILKVWPGTDEDLRAAMIVDLSFALRRRNHGRR